MKVFGLVVAVLVVLAALVMLLGGGTHGPGRHLSLASPPPPDVSLGLAA